MAVLDDAAIDRFLDPASPNQRELVWALRALVEANAPALDESVNTGRWLTGYLFYGRGDEEMVFAIGLTAAKSVTAQLMPLYGSAELRSRYGAIVKPYSSGKSCLRFKSVDELPIEALTAIFAAAPRYLEVIDAMRAQRPKPRPRMGT